MRRAFQKTSPIGLDLGSHSFKAVQLSRSGVAWKVVSSVSLPRRAPAEQLAPAEIQRFKEVLGRRRFIGDDVVVAVPASNLLAAVLEMPVRTANLPVEQITRLEFARVHKQDAALLTMSAWELPPPARASKATYMLAVGAPSAALEAHIDLVESAQFNVVAIDEPYSAAARGCLPDSGHSGLTALIDLGWNAAILVIIHNGAVVYTRKLAEGGLSRLYRSALEASAGETNVVDHEIWQVGFASSGRSTLDDTDVLDILDSHVAGLFGEIIQAFSYITHQYPEAVLTDVFLTGGGAMIPGIVERFQAEIASTTGGPRIASGNKYGLPPAMNGALGLALWSGAANE